MRHARSLLTAPLLLALAACSQPANDTAATSADPAVAPDPVAEPAAATASAATATVSLAPTEGNAVAGTLTFRVEDGAVRATGQVTGLGADTQHGFHLHEHGDCSAPDAESAGGHFNPAGSEHGRVGHGAHHGGDSDNLVADADGVATVDARFEGVTIGDGGATDIIGRGVIVHADPDDYFTQPTGNAGARLACGVVQAAQ
jgi:superoxide dismutase, Cu-Zn family